MPAGIPTDHFCTILYSQFETTCHQIQVSIKAYKSFKFIKYYFRKNKREDAQKKNRKKYKNKID